MVKVREMKMTAFEELFQMTTKFGLSTISKKAPHNRWRIEVSMPCGANLTGAKGNPEAELILCEIDADTPHQAAEAAVIRLKERIEFISERKKDIIERQVTE